MKSILVRPGKPEDAPYIREFTSNTFEWGDYVGDIYESWLTDGEVLVAEASGKPVGLNHIAYLSPFEAWFEGIRVHPDYRKAGIGKLLTTASLQRALTKGISEVRLLIAESNFPSQHLARSCGFARKVAFKEYVKPVEGPQTSPSLEVIVASSERAGEIVELGLKEVSLVGGDFRWMKLRVDTLLSRTAYDEIAVALDSSGRVSGAAFVGNVWKESSQDKGVSASLEVGTVFGTPDGVKSVVTWAQNRLAELATDASRRSLYVVVSDSQPNTGKALEDMGFSRTSTNEFDIAVWEKYLLP